MSNSVIGALRVMLGMDTAEFESGATRAQRSAQRFEKDMEKLGSKMQKVGAGMTLAITAPLAAFGMASVKAASDAAELQDAFDRTFGANAAAMNKWAEQTGNAVNRATQTMQQGAFRFGVILESAFNPAQAAEMSKALTERAVDLGSLFNVDDATAIQKLLSGLSGESEPLKEFGVLMTEAAVKAKAFEMGLGGVTGQLTEQEKIQARFALIMEQTSRAQGNAAETAGSSANAMKGFSESVLELQAAIGQQLLPVFTPLVQSLTETIKWFAELPEPVKQFSIVAAGVAAAMGPALVALGTIVSVAPKIVAAFGAIRVASLALMTNPVFWAFAGALAAIYVAWKNWDKIEAIVRKVYDGVKKWLGENLATILRGVLNPIGAVTEGFRRMYVAVVGNSYVPDMVDEIGQHFARLSGLMVDPAQKAAKNTTEAMRDMARETQAILAEAFPEDAARFDLAQKLKAFDRVADQLGMSDNDRARGRLNLQGAKWTPQLSPELQGLMAAASTQIEMIPIKLGEAASKTQISTVRIAESFRDMAQNSIRALDDMVKSIQGGGFLDILGSAVNLFLQLGSTGLFGKGLAANLNAARVPGFANGGALQLGGFAGMDRNLLSLNGTPIARVSRGEMMEVRPANDRSGGGGASRVHVTVGIDQNTGNLTAFVDGRAAGVVSQAAPAIASGGATRAQGQMSQRARRRFR